MVGGWVAGLIDCWLGGKVANCFDRWLSVPFLGTLFGLQLSYASSLLLITANVVFLPHYNVVHVSKRNEVRSRIPETTQIICLLHAMGVSYNLPLQHSSNDAQKDAVKSAANNGHHFTPDAIN